MKSGAISGWTDADQFQIWSSHSLILEIQIITYIIYQSIMGMLTYFHSILGRELGPSGVSTNQRSRWKHAFSPLKHI